MTTLPTDEQNDSVRKLVREGYASIAKETSAGCCGTGVSCCGSTPQEADKLARELGYTVEELKALPDGAKPNSSVIWQTQSSPRRSARRIRTRFGSDSALVMAMNSRINCYFVR